MTDFDAGAYRCVIRMHVLGGAETIAEFMSDLVVFGENYCTVENELPKTKT